jgi:hypothetical protein
LSKYLRFIVVCACALVLPFAFSGTGSASSALSHHPAFSSGLELLQELSEGGDLAINGNGAGGGQVDNTTCTQTAAPSGASDLSCDDNFSPEDETPIVVDPADPNHLLAGSNDYHLTFKGGGLVARVPTGFFVSFDGGTHWIDGQIPEGSGGGGGNGDPSPAFDRKFGTAHMAQLSAGCGIFCGHISVSVSTSTDGGRTWGNAVTVAQGQGSLTPSANAVFQDKEWLTADNNPSSPFYGRLYLTWTQFTFSGFNYLESPIFMSTSDDAGKTWTTPKEISGSNPAICTFQSSGPANQCDENQFSVPVVLPNGNVVVHFFNEQNQSLWDSPFEFDDQILVVRSTDGGAHFSAPIFVTGMEDGARDYPFNVDGRQTQTGHQFRTQTVQGMTADPITGDLYIFFADNRDGTHDSANPITQTNILLSKSTDGGRTWTGPVHVTTGNGDRWMPWAGARGGTVKIMYMDGSVDRNRDLYGIKLATSTNGGATFSTQAVGGLSDPDHSLWFRAHAPDCDECATFIGDYNGLAIDSLGRTHIVWTDLSRSMTLTQLNRTGAPSEPFYARR